MPAAICHHRKPEIIFSLFLLLAVSPPSQTMVAILKVMNSSILSCYNACSMNATCVLHKACLLHAFFPHDWGWCWMQMPWQGDWQCVCKFLHRSPETLALNDWVSVHMTRWSPVSRPGKASDKKKKKHTDLCTRLHEATYYFSCVCSLKKINEALQDDTSHCL